MSYINRLNLTCSHGVLSHVLHSKLSELGNEKPTAMEQLKESIASEQQQDNGADGGEDTPVTWDDLNEEERQLRYDEVKEHVETGDTDLEEYRTLYEKTFEEPSNLADDDIIWLVARYSYDDDTPDDVVTAMHDAEHGTATGEEADNEEVMDQVAEQTHTIADKLKADERFKAKMAETVTAYETVARGPVEIDIHLSRILTPEDWMTMPVPGSKKPEDKKGKKQGDNEEMLWDITPTKKGNRKINVSWYEQLTKEVFPTVWTEAEDINETFKPLEERNLNTPERKALAKLPPLKRQSLKKTRNTRRNRHIDLIRRAVRVHRLRDQLRDVRNSDGKKVIGVEYAWETHPTKKNNYEGVLLEGSNPILVWDATIDIPTEKVGDSYTVGTFLKFEAGLKKMLSSGAEPSYGELDETLARNREAAAAEKRTKRFTVENIEDWLFSMSANANFMDKADNLRAFKKHIESQKKVHEEPAEGEDPVDPRLMTEREHEIFMFMEMYSNLHGIVNWLRAQGGDDLIDAHIKGDKITYDELLDEQDQQALKQKELKLRRTG